MNLRFYKRPSTKKGVYRIYLKVVNSKNNIDYRTSTGIEISHKDWGEGFPKNTSTARLPRTELNRLIADFDSFKIENRETLTHSMVEEFFKLRLGKAEQKEKVKDFIADYLSESKKENEKKTVTVKDQHLKWLEGRVKNISLSEFTPQWIKKKLTPSLLTLQVKNSKKRFDADPSLELVQAEIGTINSYIKNIKAFINYLEDDGLIEKGTSISLKKRKEGKKDIIALNKSERELILGAELNDLRLSKVLDLFKINCYVGLRFENLHEINRDSINDSCLNASLYKTKDTVIIPLPKDCNRLLEKYNYDLPLLANSNANKYLKEIFEIIGLDRKVKKSILLPNKRIDKYFPLYEVASFGLARKTFISNSVQMGFSIDEIKGLTGHSSSEINKYLDIDISHKKEMVRKIEGQTNIERKVYD